MLMAEPGEALRRTRVALRDGRLALRDGRLALATWDRPDRNLWMSAPRNGARLSGRDAAAQSSGSHSVLTR